MRQSQRGMVTVEHEVLLAGASDRREEFLAHGLLAVLRVELAPGLPLRVDFFEPDRHLRRPQLFEGNFLQFGFDAVHDNLGKSGGLTVAWSILPMGAEERCNRRSSCCSGRDRS
jgi:hypothetical protein